MQRPVYKNYITIGQHKQLSILADQNSSLWTLLLPGQELHTLQTKDIINIKLCKYLIISSSPCINKCVLNALIFISICDGCLLLHEKSGTYTTYMQYRPRIDANLLYQIRNFNCSGAELKVLVDTDEYHRRITFLNHLPLDCSCYQYQV
jgi:hypothetical protein